MNTLLLLFTLWAADPAFELFNGLAESGGLRSAISGFNYTFPAVPTTPEVELDGVRYAFRVGDRIVVNDTIRNYYWDGTHFQPLGGDPYRPYGARYTLLTARAALDVPLPDGKVLDVSQPVVFTIGGATFNERAFSYGVRYRDQRQFLHFHLDRGQWSAGTPAHFVCWLLSLDLQPPIDVPQDLSPLTATLTERQGALQW
jgi:hypothetical protein